MRSHPPIDRPNGAAAIVIHEYRRPADVGFVAALSVVCVLIGFVLAGVAAWGTPTPSSAITRPIGAQPTEWLVLIPGSPVVIEITAIPSPTKTISAWGLTATAMPTATRAPIQPTKTPTQSFRSATPASGGSETG
jgi:hypothetical protein